MTLFTLIIELDKNYYYNPHHHPLNQYALLCRAHTTTAESAEEQESERLSSVRLWARYPVSLKPPILIYKMQVLLLTLPLLRASD